MQMVKICTMLLHYGTIRSSSHRHIMCSPMHRHSKECAKTAGFTPFVNNIVDLAISHMRM